MRCGTGQAIGPAVRTGRQVEFQLRRQTGIAGVLPVGVPARRQPQPQADAERLAWRDRVGVRDQRGCGARAGDRRAFQGDGGTSQPMTSSSGGQQAVPDHVGMHRLACHDVPELGVPEAQLSFTYSKDPAAIASMLPELPISRCHPVVARRARGRAQRGAVGTARRRQDHAGAAGAARCAVARRRHAS